MLLSAENQRCIDFNESCNKAAILEVREVCPNIKLIRDENVGIAILYKTGYECVEKIPNNSYVKKYIDLLDITLDKEIGEE